MRGLDNCKAVWSSELWRKKVSGHSGEFIGKHVATYNPYLGIPGFNLKNLEARLIRRHIFRFRVQIFAARFDLAQPDVGKIFVQISNEFNFEEIALAKDLAHLVWSIRNQKLFS